MLRLGFSGDGVHKSGEKAHAGRGVDSLAEDPCRDTTVEVEKLPLLDNVGGDLEGRRLGGRFPDTFPGQLDTDLS